MSDNVGKFALGLVSLVILWIGVYWWWEPSEPPISFGAAPQGQREAAPEGDLPADPPGTPDISGDTGPLIQPASLTLPSPKPVVAVNPPQFQEYTVRAGDTLRTISIKFFGTAAHAGSIARANPLMDPARLRAGRVIRVPKDADNIQGRPVPRPTTSTAAAPPRPAPPPKASGQRTYTVRAGDTLSAIAQDQYGSSGKAELIFDANRDKMKDRDELKIGMVLTIPAEAPGRGN
jgi:nucleoid-associated protein YgaU